ncbi:MAG: hypothetical protein V1847_01535 [Candidatus Diapherotrites archaeon]
MKLFKIEYDGGDGDETPPEEDSDPDSTDEEEEPEELPADDSGDFE